MKKQILGVLFIVFLIYLVAMDHEIRSKFEVHRWNLPSRIYSSAFTLFPGGHFSQMEVSNRLDRLAYKNVSEVHNIGEYSVQGHELDIYLHHFQYPSDSFEGFPARLTFDGANLTSIQNLKTGVTLDTLKIEPELIASLFDLSMEDRTLISIAEVPQSLIDAILAVEDERFYEHHGVDPRAIARALFIDLIHMDFREGGSTLTQQLVKNYFLTSKKSILRKFNELWMALLLEWHYSKQEILESYLNEIYFGQQGPISVTGIEEAARFYLSKTTRDLTLADSALLAAMIKAPGIYAPAKNRGRERRNLVLKLMADKGYITEARASAAQAEEIILAPRKKTFQAPYFVHFVQDQLKENFPKKILTERGLKIFTTLDLRAQELAEKAVQTHLGQLESNTLKKNKGKRLEGALVALQPQTGAIRAMVGGRDYGLSQLNRVTQAHRQPGSAFKPFVYLTALANGHTLASRLEDRAITVKLAGKDWSPKNYDGVEHKEVSFRQALENSYNLATVRLAIDVGLDEIVDLAQLAGIQSALSPYPSLALGAFEVTPLELARSYTLFPNQGIRTEPIGVEAVVTPDGEVLERKGLKMKRVVSPEDAYLMNSTLKGVLDRGTGRSARTRGFLGLAAGKTGTTSDYRDSWFVGYTPDLLVVTWVGYDDGAQTGLSGASGALPIWADFMKGVAPPGQDQIDFSATDQITLEKISESGKLWRRGCGEFFVEAFVVGTEPKEHCESE